MIEEIEVKGPELPPGATPPMAPGAYMEKRRKAARLTQEEVAIAVGREPQRRAWALNELRMLEAGDPGDYQDLVASMTGLFRFDRHIYFALVGAQAAPELPVPQVCRQCACSWMDPCLGTKPCSWVEGDSTLCTSPRCLKLEGIDAS